MIAVNSHAVPMAHTVVSTVATPETDANVGEGLPVGARGEPAVVEAPLRYVALAASDELGLGAASEALPAVTAKLAQVMRVLLGR